MKTALSGQKFRFIVALLLICTLLFGLQMTSLAADADINVDDYDSWSAYKEAGNETPDWNTIADCMDVVFDHAAELYEQGDSQGAYDWVNKGYYNWYETTGFERIAMGYIAGSRKTEVELQFASCKAVTKNGGTQEEFETELETLKSMIHEDANILDGTSDDSDSDSEESSDTSASSSGSSSTAASVAAFTACFSIILREGLEAILIVGAIIAYVAKDAENDKARQRRKTTPIYIGSVIGIIASFGLAWLLNAIKLANSASQEIIEGVTALLAVCVLYYVSNWMLSKAETDAWTGYIKSKAEASSERGSLFALAGTAFLAVFREGAEVVLFYQPMLATYEHGSIWSGLIVGCVCLVIIFILIRVISIRIPIKPFFTATSILMFLMSISFLGAGIKELIEGDVIAYISPTWLQWIPTNDFLDVLGIYPTLQTLLPQLGLLILSIILFVTTTRKNRRIHAEAEAKRAEERAAREAEEKKAADEAFEARVSAVVLSVLSDPDKAKEKLESYRRSHPALTESADTTR